MVPASQLRYGSIFMAVMEYPLLLSKRPMEEVTIPLPRPDSTPPVTTIYFGITIIAHPLKELTVFTGKNHSHHPVEELPSPFIVLTISIAMERHDKKSLSV